MLSAEDDAADTIRPRLEAAGADLSRVFVLRAIRVGTSGDTTERPFSLGSDLPRLRDMLAAIGDVALVIVDPISAYLGNVDSHRNSEVRALLHPLSQLAGEHKAAILCVSHLNKGGNKDALHRVTGSLAFVAAARAAFVVVKDRDVADRRLFLPLKNNIGNDQSGLAFAVVLHRLANGIETSRVQWEKDAVTTSASDALAEPKGEDNGALIAAEEFLRALLEDGPVATKQIESDAQGAGHTWSTIRRAKFALRVEAVKSRGEKGAWTWQLPKKPKY
jgi:hypothetical protein